jgi:hypothetical protein
MKKQEQPKQEKLEEAAERVAKLKYGATIYGLERVNAFKEGAKWLSERMYSKEDMIAFAEFVATYPNKNRNIHHEILHAKSKYDGAERTIDLLAKWFEQNKKK